MSLKQEINKIDESVLEKLFEFVAHISNDTGALKSACEELSIRESDGMAFVNLLADLGINHSTDVYTMNELYDLQRTFSDVIA